MGVHLDLVSGDQIFRSRATNPVIVNDFNSTSQVDQDHLSSLIYTSHEGDVLTNIPSCECGAESGNHHIRFYQGQYRGTLCRKCGTEVKRKAEHNLDPLIWIRAPKHVKSLISPQAWIMMKKRLTKSGVELVRWICDTSYVPVKKIPALYELEGEMASQSPPLERGLNNFVDRFEEYLDILFSLRSLRNKEKVVMYNGRDPLHHLLLTRKDDVFWEYMPLPNRALLLIEKTHMGAYVDLNIKEAVDAVNIMKGIDSELFNYDLRTKQNRSVKAIAVLAEFYRTFYTDTLAKKPGLFRKQIFGGRSHFSFRAVITSITEAHDYDEIHLPWGIAVAVLRVHITSVLLAQGKKPLEIVSLLNEYAHRYHPGLYAIMMDFIMRSDYRTNGAIGKPGIPCIMQRNPTLEMASAQYVMITDIKTDTKDQTVSISILSVKGLTLSRVFVFSIQPSLEEILAE